MSQSLTPAQIYAQLEARVLPRLRDYQTDLTEHDRKTLAQYDGPFLLSYRPSGTNLLVLGPVKEYLIAGDPRSAAEQIKRTFDRKRAEVAWEYQTHFLAFDGQQFHELTRAEALALTDEHLARALASIAGPRQLA